MKTIPFLVLITIFLCSNCSVNPKPIEYGIDNCNYCEMTIVDNKHSAELVTTKGKVYKFDAIECMIRHLQNTENQQYQFVLIADYAQPGNLVDANNSFFLISENIPSPMGENLSGFKSESIALEYSQTNGGKVYDWNEIASYFSSE